LGVGSARYLSFHFSQLLLDLDPHFFLLFGCHVSAILLRNRLIRAHGRGTPLLLSSFPLESSLGGQRAGRIAM
jgi:hypothetical protein